MAMTSVSVMMTVFVLNLHYRGPKKNEIPFWLQQVLSLSVSNIVRTIRKSKKLKIPLPNKKDANRHREYSREKNKCQLKQELIPSNGSILSSYTNINERKIKSRVTTDVSKQTVYLFIKNI